MGTGAGSAGAAPVPLIVYKGEKYMKKTTKKLILALAAGALAAGLVAGCGNSEKPASSAAASGQKVTVKTVVASNEPPLAWKDESGKVQGYEYDVLQEVNKRLKSYTLEIDAIPPETQDVLMESGEAKVAAEGYYINAKRQENFLIPKNPIGASSLVVYVKKGDETKYKSLKDIVDAHVKFAPLSPNGGAFRILTDWNEKNGKPLAEIPVQAGLSPAERVRAIKEGQYDAYITPNNLGIEKLAEKEGVELVPLEEPIKVNPTVVLVNKNEKKLADEIDAALGEIKKDGTLAKISEKWYGSDLTKILDKK